MKKKSGRRKERKAPKRMPRGAATRRSTGPLMPVVRHEDAYSWLESDLPAELAPLYALIGIFRYDAGGQPANSCVEVCYQLGRALQLLGFEAQLAVACASVFHREAGGEVKVTDVGVWDRQPQFDPMLRNYSGHVVLYSSSFSRLIDLTIAQNSTLQQRMREESALGIPVVLPITPGADPFVNTPATLRGQYLITYMLSAELVSTLAPVWLNTGMVTAMERAAVALASWALDVLRTIDRDEPQRWRQTAPQLRRLLDGEALLPAAEELSATTRPWEGLLNASAAHRGNDV